MMKTLEASFAVQEISDDYERVDVECHSINGVRIEQSQYAGAPKVLQLTFAELDKINAAVNQFKMCLKSINCKWEGAE